jgi:hypothetical protein
MITVRTAWGKKVLVFIFYIVALNFIINFLFNCLLNYALGSYVFPKINNNQRHLYFKVNFQLFPSTIIRVKDLTFAQDNKNIATIKELSVSLDLWELFKRKLHIHKVSVNNSVINFYNIPSIHWQKRTKKWVDKTNEEESLNVEKSQPDTNPKDPFFELEQVELINVQLNYSEAITSAPIYLNSVTFNNKQSTELKSHISGTGSWASQHFHAMLTISFQPSNPLIKADVTFADSNLSFIAKINNNNYQAQTHISIKNPNLFGTLLAIPPEQVPLQVNVSGNLINNQLRIVPFQVVFPGAELNASITRSLSSPSVINIALPESLLTTLSGTVLYTHCPLPSIVSLLIKATNTQLIIIRLQSTGKDKKSLVSIDDLGIQFTDFPLPFVLQENLKACFDYQLQDEATKTTYSIKK